MAVAARRYAHDDLGMLNRKAFQRRGALRRFGLASGWLERGEQIAVLSVAEAVRGAPILDIRVGGRPPHCTVDEGDQCRLLRH